MVNWLIARNIVIGWVLTLPGAAAVSALAYGVIDVFGPDSAVGPVVLSAALAVGGFLLWQANRRSGPRPEDTVSDNPAFGVRPSARPAEVPA